MFEIFKGVLFTGNGWEVGPVVDINYHADGYVSVYYLKGPSWAPIEKFIGMRKQDLIVSDTYGNVKGN